MSTKIERNQKGVALLLSILALLLLSAIAVSMMYMSSTETAVNANFKNEEIQYFAARAGIEEIRDRMIPGVAPYSINGLAAGPNPPCPGSPNCYLPTALPTGANGQVVYLLQSKMTTTSLTNFGAVTGCANGQPGCMVDDELCHDYAIAGMTLQPPNVRCNNLPAGNAWCRSRRARPSRWRPRRECGTELDYGCIFKPAELEMGAYHFESDQQHTLLRGWHYRGRMCSRSRSASLLGRELGKATCGCELLPDAYTGQSGIPGHRLGCKPERRAPPDPGRRGADAGHANSRAVCHWKWLRWRWR
jgi:hypothetical protein